MRRFTVTLTLIFSFFILSNARTPFKPPPENVISQSNPSTTTTLESVAKPIILLPDEKLESEPLLAVENVAEYEAVPVQRIAESHLPESDTITAIGIARPLMITYNGVSFQPINRHFQHMHDVKRQFHYHFPHHCHHHGKPFFGPQLPLREIQFGDDMIPLVQQGEDVVDKIPARWMGISKEMRGFPTTTTRPIRVKEGLLKGKRKVVDKEAKEKQKERREERDFTFMKHFRKFLNRV